MIQVNRIYLIFNRLVTKKFLVDTSDNNHTTNNTLFKKIESHEKVIPIYELGNAYIIRLCR